MINDFINSLTINSYQFSNKGSDEYVLNQFMARGVHYQE